MVMHHTESQAVFTGDVFGLSYRALGTPQGPFLFPTTAPTQLDPAAMLASIQRIEELEPRWVLLTHYGSIAWDPRFPRDLREMIGRWCEAALRLTPDGIDGSGGLQALELKPGRSLRDRYERLGCQVDQTTFERWIDMDAGINALGPAT